MRITRVKSNAIFLILLTTGLIILGGVFFYNNGQGSTVEYTQSKCPDDYGTDTAGSAEYLASMDKWTNDFYDTNPGASLTDWASARHQFWIDNNCKAALERYEEARGTGV